jgi:hypothetical protein
MQYFADASTRDRVRYRKMPRVVGVFGSPDRLLMIGIGRKIGRAGDDIAVWSLRIGAAEVPGYWTIIDGKFVPVEYAGPVQYRALGKLWKALHAVGFLGVCGSLSSTITAWIIGDPGHGNQFVVAGLLVASWSRSVHSP